MIIKLLKFIFSLIILLGAISIPVFFTPIGDLPLKMLLATGDIEPTDFKTLSLNENPNQYLVCQPDICSADAHAQSPVFPVPVEQLKAIWEGLIQEQANIEIVTPLGDGNYQDLVQRTRLVRYPDIISVAFYPLTENRSTLALYSRSVYGRSDFNTNRERIDAWLLRLHTLTARP